MLFDCVLQSRSGPEWPCLPSDLPTARTCANVASLSSSTCGGPSGTSSSPSSRHCKKPFLLRSMWPSSSNPTISGRNRRPTLAAPNSSLRWGPTSLLTPVSSPFCHPPISHLPFSTTLKSPTCQGLADNSGFLGHCGLSSEILRREERLTRLSQGYRVFKQSCVYWWVVQG